MSALRPRRVLPVIAVAALTFIIIFVWKNGTASLRHAPSWAISAVRIKLSLDQDASAGAYYDRTAGAPLPLATIVSELRKAWPGQSDAVVNASALEVGTALLHRSDIEVGELIDGKFVRSNSSPWHANQKMLSDVRAAPTFFEDSRAYVFRRK